MSRRSGTLPVSYFEGLYAADPDPWRFATSDYERGKYAATLAALRPRYDHALEVGCSIGVLTRQLAERCRALAAMEPAPSALAAARARCAELAQVRFVEGTAPADWPGERFDLILLSEVVYYLDRADVARLAGRVDATLAPDGDLVLVHWTGETNYPLGGDEAAEALIAILTGTGRHRLDAARSRRHEQYRLDVLARA